MKYVWQKTYSLLVLFILLSNILSSFAVLDSTLDPRNYPTGAKPLSEKQIGHIKTNWPRILGVRPNKYGAARIQEHMKGKEFDITRIKVAANYQEEFITNKNYDSVSVHKALGAAALPSKVDNSKLACFPPIGNQNQQGSCVGWASTYYQATHEYGLLNGINNKTSSAGIRSPKWTYNMINSGQDAGSYPQDAYELLRTNGAPALNNFPYDTNYREWDLNTQDWISALSYRMGQPLFLNVNGQADIDTIKQILNNGHLVTFITFAYSWQFTKVGADPSQANPYAGQSAISWMNGTDGGHHTTIVGYDDNVWIDVNGNGRVDAGEKGAFLIANSWGTGWANGGYVWISYDAFLKSSMVVNGPNANRQQVAQMLFSTTAKSPNYSPKAVAKFSISQNSRQELKISLGSSDINANSPSTTFVPGALTQDGGAFAFDGQSARLETATFVLDATDLLPATNIAQKYYLTIQDTSSGNKTTLNSYSIVDLVNNKEVAYSGTPLTADNSTIQPSIVFQQNYNPTPPTPPIPPIPTKPTIKITNPTNFATINGSVDVTANINANVKVTKVEFYVDSKLINVDLSSPFVFLLDTTKLSNGQHTIVAIVYDDAGNTASDNITVTVQNSSDNTGFPIYLSYQQKKDSGWGSGAQYSATLTNKGTKYINDFKIKFLVQPANIDLWNVSVNSSDSQSVTIGFPSWTKSLAPGEILSFGFVISPEVEPKVSFISATQV